MKPSLYSLRSLGGTHVIIRGEVMTPFSTAVGGASVLDRAYLTNVFVRAAICGLAYALYAFIFVQLYPKIGPASAAFSILPMIVIGWAFGVPGGLIGGALNFLANMLVFDWVGNSSDNSPLVNLVASLAMTLVGLSVGWIHSLSQRVRKQSDELLAKQYLLEAEIDRRRHVEGLLRHDALHDPLTDLANRRLLLDRLAHALERNRRQPANPSAVLYLDIDRFKQTNDRMGHEVGDQLLSIVAERIKSSIRAVDTAGRLGGDEFVVILEGCASKDVIGQVVQRIHKVLNNPFDIDGQTYYGAVSIGVVSDIQFYQRIEDILRDADAAMYFAKTEGGNRCKMFEPGMQKVVGFD